MATTFEVLSIRRRQTDFPVDHEHVTHVMLASRAVEPAVAVATRIAAGDRYVMTGGRARVRVSACPLCFAPDHLAVGRGRANQLLDLPSF